MKAYDNIADASLKRKYKDATWAKSWDDEYPFTAPVGMFAKNRFGLHDMHGNVVEWCQDRFDKYPDKDEVDPGGPTEGSRRVLRGGDWHRGPRGCRSADRHGIAPEVRDSDLGFRVARVPSGSK